MTNKEIFKIWAPIGAKWIDWVRPVPFISINEQLKTFEFHDFTISNINYIDKVLENIGIIVDLPSDESLKEGIGLAKLGYRPIPIYNGTNEQEGAMATTNNHSIEPGLIWGAFELKNMEIKSDALPVFLLDSNRLNLYKMKESVFDNSWDIYDQDVPSAEYFLKNNVNQILVRAEKIHRDLKKILYKYQQKGIKILFTNGYEEPREVKIKKPPHKDK